MLFATHLAVVVLAATSAAATAAAPNVPAGAPDLPISPPNPLKVISPVDKARGIFAHPPSIPPAAPAAPASPAPPAAPAAPMLPIGMRRMLDHGYPFSAAPTPTAKPPVSPPVAVPEQLTNSERLALGLPVRPPSLLRRLLPGSPLDGCKNASCLLCSPSLPKLTRVVIDTVVDKDAIFNGGLARVPRPSGIPKKRHGPSMLPLAVAALPIPTPPHPAPRANVPATPVGSIDELAAYCAVSGKCQTGKAMGGRERDW